MDRRAGGTRWGAGSGRTNWEQKETQDWAGAPGTVTLEMQGWAGPEGWAAA